MMHSGHFPSPPTPLVRSGRGETDFLVPGPCRAHARDDSVETIDGEHDATDAQRASRRVREPRPDRVRRVELVQLNALRNRECASMARVARASLRPISFANKGPSTVVSPSSQRPSSMKSRGLLVIRFRNEALEKDIWRVVEEIIGALGECEPDGQAPSPTLPTEGREPAKKKLEPPRGAGKEKNGAAKEVNGAAQRREPNTKGELVSPTGGK